MSGELGALAQAAPASAVRAHWTAGARQLVAGSACMGVALLAAVAARAVATAAASLAWIAPLGASALLLFYIPASPLVRPWAVLAGNTVSALLGFGLHCWLGGGLPSAVLAGACAAGVMYLLRCLHPPGSAVAVGTALHGAGAGLGVGALGWGLAVAPVVLGSAVLVLLAIGLNRCLGRRYPHRHEHPPAIASSAVAPPPLTRADIEAALKGFGEPLDIDADDLLDLLRDAQRHAMRRAPRP